METDRATWLEKYPPTPHPQLWGLWEGLRPGNAGGGGAATAVEKGGRMSATPAENKQTTLGAGWWQKARFPPLAWQSLKQGLCISEEEPEAPRGHALCPECLSSCSIASRPMPIPPATLGLSFPT